jgi:hypothetical protein
MLDGNIYNYAHLHYIHYYSGRDPRYLSYGGTELILSVFTNLKFTLLVSSAAASVNNTSKKSVNF